MVINEMKCDVHHTVDGYPEHTAGDEEPGPENVSQEKHLVTTGPSRPTVHTKPGEHLHQYTSQHNLSVTPQSAKETGTRYYLGQEYVDTLSQGFEVNQFKTKAQHEAVRALRSALKSDYYKESILKKYHDSIEWERGRPARQRAKAEAQKAIEDAEEKEIEAMWIGRADRAAKADCGFDEYPWRDNDDVEARLSHLAYRAGIGTEDYIRLHGMPPRISNFEARLNRAAYRAGMGTEEYIRYNGHNV
jgi:hypothetical protein